MFRLFVALDIPDEIRRQLGAMTSGLPGAKWTRPENLHLTLRFIARSTGPHGTMWKAHCPVSLFRPSPLSLEGLGHWESKGKPRVLWAGVTPSDALEHLQHRIETAVVSAGSATGTTPLQTPCDARPPRGDKRRAALRMARSHPACPDGPLRGRIVHSVSELPEEGRPGLSPGMHLPIGRRAIRLGRRILLGLRRPRR